jgi:UDP-N-acetylglucosamine 2-epimerase (non-hydrolysing)
MPLKVLTILGTRPEAIKLASVINTLRARSPQFSTQLCLTGQHRELVQDLLPLFGLTAHENLDVMTAGQTLCSSTASILAGLQGVLERTSPDLVLVQGDTTTAFCGALAAFYAKIPVGHIEAGLRTGDVHGPFPEEMNRRLVTRLAAFHFAATRTAADNLYSEGVPPSRIWITGNTGIDAVLQISNRLAAGDLCSRLPVTLDTTRKVILVTAHRRESLETGLTQIASGVRRLAEREDVQIVFPLHPNPKVQAKVKAILSGHNRVHLIDPLDYASFADLMCRSHLILSDSGGIQEEAPALGKPVLVLRNTTERPEAVTAGANRLIGTGEHAIVEHATQLLDDPHAYRAMARPRDIYGNGSASRQICDALANHFQLNPSPAQQEPALVSTF